MKEVVQALKENDQYIIVGHEHPDPDSLGSMIALYFGLKQMGKQCRMISSDPIPPNLNWAGLELIEVVDEHFILENEIVIVVDCEPDRTGNVAQALSEAQLLINIDHHEGNSSKAELKYVNPNEPATCVLIYRLLQELSVALDFNIATSLYAGIMGDTGGFRHANTTSEVLQIAAKLVAAGAKPDQLARQVFNSKPLNFMQLLGHSLSNLQHDLDGKLVWIVISQADFKRYQLDPTDTDQLVQYARMVDTTEIAVLFREISPREVRIGWRGYNHDVGEVARSFGGGGHRLASGAKLNGELESVVKDVLDKTKQLLS